MVLVKLYPDESSAPSQDPRPSIIHLVSHVSGGGQSHIGHKKPQSTFLFWKGHKFIK